MNDFIFRKANLSDLEQILKLENLITDFTSTENTFNFWNYDILKSCIENPSSGLILYVEYENTVAGFAIVKYNEVFRTAKIDQLYILPKYRNSGIGKKLFDLIIENIKQTKINSILSLTEFNNASVINFFEKQGFEKSVNNVKLIKNL